MSANIVNVHNRDPVNVGDRFSAVHRYGEELNLPALSRAKPGAIWTYNFASRVPFVSPDLEGKNVIVGGGGLVGTDFFDAGMKRISEMRRSGKIPLLIMWGAGHNAEFSRGDARPTDYLGAYDLIGIRDKDSQLPGEWVPCASCMMPQLDAAARLPIEHDVVVYDQRSYRTGLAGEHPTLSNKTRDINQVLAHLASGETVVTSSYHGVEWATWMGRKVVLMNPFSTKFSHMAHPPVVGDGISLDEAVSRARAYPDSLAESRSATRRFSLKVARLLNS